MRRSTGRQQRRSIVTRYPDAHGDTHQAHLLMQEKAEHPLGTPAAEVNIGRASSASSA